MSNNMYDRERCVRRGAWLVCSGVKFRKIRSVVKRIDGAQHLFPEVHRFSERLGLLPDEMKHVFRLQPSSGHLARYRSTLFAGVSEGVNDFTLGIEQTTGSKDSTAREILLDTSALPSGDSSRPRSRSGKRLSVAH